MSSGVLPRRAHRSVGAHLLAIAVALAIVLAAGLYAGVRSAADARQRARREVTSTAELAGRALGDEVAATHDRVEALAANPAYAAMLTDPSTCTLTFSDAGFFPGAHLDLVDGNGVTVCSSSAPLTAQVPRGASLVIGAPLYNGQAQPVGTLTISLPSDGTAAALDRAFAGAQQPRFTVVTSVEGVGSTPPTERGVLFGRAVVPGASWQVYAGVSEAAAMHSTYLTLRREALLAVGVLIVALVGLWLVHRRIVLPLRQLTRAVRDARDQSAVVPLTGGVTEMRELAHELSNTLAARDGLEAELSRVALHDPLTGLPNRALLNDRLAHVLSTCHTPGAVAVLLIDLDHFKLINDSLGHTAGDEVLMTIGTRLAEHVGAGATVARFSGDEFVVVCERLGEPGGAFTVAQRLREIVEAPLEVRGRMVTVTASIGVAISRRDSAADDLLREADTARYAAKELGRAQVHQFTEGLRRKVARRLTIENELRGALDGGVLRLEYQPIVELATGDTVGAEALLRWDHPTLGTVSPAVFIPIAEETGLISTLGEYALDEACRQAAAWRDEDRRLRISVNASGRQISDRRFPALVASALRNTNLTADLLCLELTESVLMSDATRTIDSLAELRSLGVTLSIDDFGTGYSSLAYLQHFPVDELKIDRAFIKGLADHSEQRTLVAAMGAMGKALGLQIVAEGVETIDQLYAVRELGCDRAQGYLFGRPQAASELRLLLGSSMPVTTSIDLT